MPQLNVYIPEDLAEALQRHRDGLNLSQICARALRQEVQKMELATQPRTSVNIPRVLERLRDAQQRQSAAYQDGISDAARWIEEEATVEELRRFSEWVPGSVGDKRHVPHVNFLNYLRKVAATGSSDAYKWLHRRTEQVKASGADENEYWPAYLKGWHETVSAAWDEVKDQL